MIFTPVVLFVYSRPTQTQALLDSLASCRYASNTDLFIFSDAAKNEKASSMVESVRKIINDPSLCSKFNAVRVFEASVNNGLAESIIKGVTQVFDSYDSVIVIEDDNIVAPDLLDYMNRGLEFYSTNKHVGFLGGYTMPINFPEDYKHDIYAMGRGSSYCWATWKDRWELVDWNVSDYFEFRNNKKARKEFDEFGADRSHLLDSQMAGKNDSWAIRFSYAMFKNNMCAIMPVKTRVQNVGFDETAVHNKSNCTKFNVTIEKDLQPVKFENVEIDPRIKKEFVRMFRPSLKTRIKRVIKRIIKRI